MGGCVVDTPVTDTPRFVFIVAAWQAEAWIEGCLQSIHDQTIQTYDVCVVDDISTDKTADLARQFCAYAQRGGDWIFWANTEKKWALRNQVEMIRHMDRGNPADIIVFVDGDDRLAHNRVLETLTREYADGTLLTYGSYEPDPPSATCHPASPYPPEVIAARSYRTHPSIEWNHLRTFRYLLFNQLQDTDFCDAYGKWMKSTTDTAMMTPCLELAGDRFKFIPETLLIYNSENPLADWRTRAEQIDADHYHVLHRLKKKTELSVDVVDDALRVPGPFRGMKMTQGRTVGMSSSQPASAVAFPFVPPERTDPYLPAEERIEVLRDYARRHGTTVFIETGTAGGDTPAALIDEFELLFTIEVGKDAYDAACKRFAGTRVSCFHGDSAYWLPKVLGGIDTPALLWLDGHYCGGDRGTKDTPVLEELEAVFATGIPHIILVDDARLFGGMSHAGEHDWPHIDEVRALAEEHLYGFEVADDIVRLTP